jgi:hypothetical protein
METGWLVEEGTGWIEIPGFGSISPRQDSVHGGRQYFDAMLDNGERAKVRGKGISGGPETWAFEFEQPFLLADRADRCVEVMISPLAGGRYAVKYRPEDWPTAASGGGW